MVKILAALSILNRSGATEKVAALVARATCSGASHSSAYEIMCALTSDDWCDRGIAARAIDKRRAEATDS